MTTPRITSQRNPLLALFLGLVLVLTAQSAAIARGTPTSAGVIELCTGTGPVMVEVDAQGQPIGRAHICPDYALSLILAQFDAAPKAQLVQIARGMIFATVQTSVSEQRAPITQARGPPSLI